MPVLTHAAPIRRTATPTRPRWLRTLPALVLGIGLLAVPAAAHPVPVAAAGASYYLDCSSGSDSAAGTSTGSAWRSLDRANRASLGPGGSLLLKRGCAWTGPLRASWAGSQASPITIGAYGSGAQPLIRDAHENVAVTGSWIVIQDLATTASPTGRDATCSNWPLGFRVGFRFMSGAHDVTVRDSTASNLYMGVLVDQGAHDNHVLHNVLRDNNMRDPNISSDAGAVGVNLMGDRTEVGWNTITGSDACSPFYGRDGAAIEIYGGRSNRIHHNRASQNNTFTELGNPRSDDNWFVYNQITSTLTASNLLVTRGGRDAKYGPVTGTRFVANTAYLSGASSYAIQCTFGCGRDVLSMHDNVIWSNDRIGYADAAFDEGHNLFWRAGGSPKVYFTTSSSDRLADPRFVSVSGLDLRLASGSPAIDMGSSAAIGLGYSTDLGDTRVPQGGNPDVGAWERATSGGTAPPPPPPPPVVVPPAPAGVNIARDVFSRRVTNGWGTTSVGGGYRVSGTPSAYAVDGSSGTMRVDRGVPRFAVLPNVFGHDMDAAVRLRVSRLSSAAGDSAFVVLRRSTDGRSEYRMRIRISSSGLVYLRATRTLAGRTSGLAAEVSTGIRVTAGTRLWVRAKVVGSTPTTLVMRAWKDGSREPSSWTYRTTDSSSALAGKGSVGLRSEVSASSTRGQVRFYYDIWTVTEP